MTHIATHSPACSLVAEHGMRSAARCCRAAAFAAARQHACLRAAQPQHVPCCAIALPERGWGAQPSTSGRPAAVALHAAALDAAPSTKKADITPKPTELPTSEESEELLRIRHSVRTCHNFSFLHLCTCSCSKAAFAGAQLSQNKAGGSA